MRRPARRRRRRRRCPVPALPPAARGMRRTARRAGSRGRPRSARPAPRRWRTACTTRCRRRGSGPMSSASRSSRSARLLHVDELRHVARGEPVLVLEARDLLAGGDPAVLLPVDADEHVALLEVGAVQLRGGCGRAPSSNMTGASRSRSIAARAARRSGSSSFSVELDEDPQPLVGRADRGLRGARPSWGHRSCRSSYRGRSPARRGIRRPRPPAASNSAAHPTRGSARRSAE